MRRDQRRKSGQSRWRDKVENPYKPQVDQPLLGDKSIAVYRSVADNALNDMVNSFRSLTAGLVATERGLAGEMPLAVSLLKTVEIRQHRELIGAVAVSDATDAIYDLTPSARRKTTVKPQSVRLFGHPKKTVRPVGIIFDEVTAKAVTDERDMIRGAIESLTDYTHEDFNWIEEQNPHISIGKIDTSHGLEVVSGLIDEMQELLPEEVLLLRATIHVAGNRQV